MNQMNNEKSNPEPQSPFQVMGRFTRLINRLDHQDQALNPDKRKRKWIFVLTGLFFLYLVSFLFPPPELLHETIEPAKKAVPANAGPDKSLNTQKSLTFEMPVDSFENILKKQIHEKLPEKK